MAKYLPIISCRIIKLSHQWGYSPYRFVMSSLIFVYYYAADLLNHRSAFGFTGLALSIRAASQSVDNFEIARRISALSSVICKGLNTEEMPRHKRDSTEKYILRTYSSHCKPLQPLCKSWRSLASCKATSSSLHFQRSHLIEFASSPEGRCQICVIKSKHHSQWQ